MAQGQCSQTPPLRDNALYLVFKIVERPSRHWRPLNGGMNFMTLVLEEETFKDGVFKRWGATPMIEPVLLPWQCVKAGSKRKAKKRAQQKHREAAI